jgi:hypothetical protein
LRPGNETNQNEREHKSWTIFAFLHHLAAFGLVSVLTVEHVLLQSEITRDSAGKLRGLDTEHALEWLASLNAAKRLKDLSPLKSVGLHKLKDSRRNR